VVSSQWTAHCGLWSVDCPLWSVVSGLPTEIADHASQIAKLSLELSTSVSDFVIRHLPNEKLQLRIGMHTGKYSRQQ